MGDMLGALHRLQAVELQLAEYRRAREAKIRRIDEQQRRVRMAEEKLQESKFSIRDRQVRLDAFQLDASAREESIDKHRQALNSAKTNKEYSGILTALNTEKADTAKIETEMLQLMEEIQTLKEGATRVDEEREQLLEEVGRSEKVLGTFDAQNRQRREELESQREECAESVEPSTLATFSRVAEHHDGEALVPVAKIHPRREEYVCSGCNMTLSLEVVNVLRTQTEIQICAVCGRILFIETAKVS